MVRKWKHISRNSVIDLPNLKSSFKTLLVFITCTPHSTSNIGSPSLGSSTPTALFMRTLSFNRPGFFHAATTFKLSGCFLTVHLATTLPLLVASGLLFSCIVLFFGISGHAEFHSHVVSTDHLPPHLTVERDATVRLDHTGPTALQSRIWFPKMFWKNSLWNALFPFLIFLALTVCIGAQTI